MKAIEIYNPKTAFGNQELVKCLAAEKLEIERKENPCWGCSGEGEIKAVCSQCDGSGEMLMDCEDCEGTGIEKK